MPEPLRLDAFDRQTVAIAVRGDDGSKTEHEFEILPLDKERYSLYLDYAKAVAPLQRQLKENPDEMPTEEDQAKASDMMLSTIDARLKSTNGPVTIRSLWDEKKLGLEHLQWLGDQLYKEFNPPA